eukprot:SAG22_NODE_327_length_12278_cov_10.550209_11_plen_65_part_00
MAFTGLAVHAFIPLQADIGELAVGRRGNGGGITWGSSIHQAAAGVFFAASLYHGFTLVGFLRES